MTQNHETQNRDLIRAGAAIAAELGDEWSVVVPRTEDRRWWVDIVRDDGAKITLNSCWNDGRWVVHGGWPNDPTKGGNQRAMLRDWLYSASIPEITVTRKKTPAQIAKDITRRFLPEYLPLYAQCLEKRDERVNRCDQKMDTARKLVDILGKQVSTTPWGSDPSISVPNMLGDSYGEIRIDYDGNTTFHLWGVPADAAIKIAEALRPLINEGESK